MIFSRRRGAGRHHKSEEPTRGSVAAKTDDRRARRAALLEDLELTEPGHEPAPAPEQPQGPEGPFDFDEAPHADRIDLGSLLLPAMEGVEVRMQATDTGVIQQLVLVHGDSSLQLGAFAAPRTDSLWDEVRAETRKSLFDGGVASDEVQGRWGIELRARVRTDQGFNDLRFLGIDGPRWMVHGVLQGPAAVDPELAGPLVDCLVGLVVRRDEEARPTREPLPLRLPEHMRPGTAPEGEPAAQASAPPKRKPSPRPRRD